MTSTTAPLTPEDFDALEDVLELLREADEEVPHWDFCEGFMAALVCCRRPIGPEEYWPVLLGDGFLPMAHMEFVWRWKRRWAEIEGALDTPVDDLSDERSFYPTVLDQRGMHLSLPESEREGLALSQVESYAQMWAVGFMYAIETWPEEWQSPRDADAAAMMDNAIQAILDLTEPDTGVPTVSLQDDESEESAPPSISQGRIDALGEAIWGLYDLRQVARSLGPRVQPIRKAEGPGRNDPCHCGSGKKFKKCHGA